MDMSDPIPYVCTDACSADIGHARSGPSEKPDCVHTVTYAATASAGIRCRRPRRRARQAVRVEARARWAAHMGKALISTAVSSEAHAVEAS